MIIVVAQHVLNHHFQMDSWDLLEDGRLCVVLPSQISTNSAAISVKTSLFDHSSYELQTNSSHPILGILAQIYRISSPVQPLRSSLSFQYLGLHTPTSSLHAPLPMDVPIPQPFPPLYPNLSGTCGQW